MLAIVEVKVAVLTNVVVGVRTISSRSGIDLCVTCLRVDGEGAASHTVREIDPGEPSNMRCLLAFERTQARPQSFCLNDFASVNMLSMLDTLDTSHLERSPLNDVAP